MTLLLSCIRFPAYAGTHFSAPAALENWLRRRRFLDNQSVAHMWTPAYAGERSKLAEAH
jgi:hypothetical protein